VVDAIISAITDSLAREERVTLVGFGTFQVMERKARKGVNPQPREAITIPSKKIPKFRPRKSCYKFKASFSAFFITSKGAFKPVHILKPMAP